MHKKSGIGNQTKKQQKCRRQIGLKASIYICMPIAPFGGKQREMWRIKEKKESEEDKMPNKRWVLHGGILIVKLEGFFEVLLTQAYPPGWGQSHKFKTTPIPNKNVSFGVKWGFVCPIMGFICHIFCENPFILQKGQGMDCPDSQKLPAGNLLFWGHFR